MATHSVINVSGLAQGLRIDPEYYQPRYLEDAGRLECMDCEFVGEFAFVTDGIHASPDEVEEGGIRYLSAKCVRSNDFSLGSVIKISHAQHEANPRTSLRQEDILITTVGTIGNAAVVQADLIPANSDRHLGIIRVNEGSNFDPYFVAAFLNSEFGRFQSLREATGNVQLNLFIEKIKKLRIPRLACAEYVAGLTRQAYTARLEALQRVAEAESAVVEALDLGHVETSASLAYTSSLAEITAGRRFGAEFYMPAKAQIMKALAAGASEPLSEHVSSVRQLWDPTLATGVIRNFDLSDAMEPFLDERFDPVDVRTIRSSKKKLRTNDVVISRLRSYLKQIAVVRCNGPDEIVGSSEFIVLRSKGQLEPETLLAYLRSEPVQTVLRWSQDGTNHPRFDEATLLSLPVPAVLLERSDEISGSVRASIEARQRMMAFLRTADAAINSEIAGNC